MIVGMHVQGIIITSLHCSLSYDLLFTSISNYPFQSNNPTILYLYNPNRSRKLIHLSSIPFLTIITPHRQSSHTFRHHTVSASKNHGLTLSINSSGDGILCGSVYRSPMRNTSHVVRLVRAKTALAIP
jgi:hypothetical protein